MQNFDPDRERAANDLAERLFFELDKYGDQFSLRRKIGDLCVLKASSGGIVRQT